MPGNASYLVIAGLAILIAFVLLGPRPRINVDSRPSPPVPNQLAEMDQWLLDQESRFDDIVDGAEKAIYWANPEQPESTEVAIVYLHGLSATRQEISPVPEDVAKALNANIYMARIDGHGRGSAAMGDFGADEWITSTWEAWHVAKTLGNKVIIIGTSTGVTLASWLINQPGVSDQVESMVFVSPNYGPKDSSSAALTYPWAETWVPWIKGDTHSWEPKNEMQAKYWTTSYPVRALHQMQALVEWARNQDYSGINIPTLFIYSDYDEVVEPKYTDEIYLQWGGAKERMNIDYMDNSSNHVIAGDILAPENNQLLVERIGRFIAKHKPGMS